MNRQPKSRIFEWDDDEPKKPAARPTSKTVSETPVKPDEVPSLEFKFHPSMGWKARQTTLFLLLNMPKEFQPLIITMASTSDVDTHEMASQKFYRMCSEKGYSVQNGVGLDNEYVLLVQPGKLTKRLELKRGQPMNDYERWCMS